MHLADTTHVVVRNVPSPRRDGVPLGNLDLHAVVDPGAAELWCWQFFAGTARRGSRRVVLL